jgi:hydrogenase expression/formation protein HypD
MLTRIANAHKLMDQACKKLGRRLNIMEVCGTHTVAIFRNGLKTTFPPDLKLISGPGCPVCVTDQGFIDAVINLSTLPEVIIATYGDMVRVPGKRTSLEKEHRADVKIVLSSTDAVKLAKENPDKKIVFLAIGFETTTPATAVAIREAQNRGIENFFILSAHKLVIPAMQALLTNKNNKIDGFLCPGHVSVIIGSDAYKPIVEKFKKPCVVAGFEPMQIIEGVAEVCRQIVEEKPWPQSIYESVVTPLGNPTALKIIDEFFTPADGHWRGLGMIPESSLQLREKYKNFDAFKAFEIEHKPGTDSTGCRCGEVLCGLIDPPECSLYENQCSPDSPVGPCMVSSEGSCAAWYKYARKTRRRS